MELHLCFSCLPSWRPLLYFAFTIFATTLQELVTATIKGNEILLLGFSTSNQREEYHLKNIGCQTNQPLTYLLLNQKTKKKLGM
jgi:hypothetical protein